MAESRSGARITSYFDKDLWKKVDLESCRLKMQPTEFIRHAVIRFIQNEAVEEIEKLQMFNFRMFKYLSNKLSHLEMLTAVAKENLEEQMPEVNFEEKLQAIKNFNQKYIEDMFEESL